jgi:hypothetical protein
MACLDLLSFLRLDLMQAVNRIDRIGKPNLLFCSKQAPESCLLLYPGHSADWILSFPLSVNNHPDRLSLLLLLHTQNMVLFSTRDTVQYGGKSKYPVSLPRLRGWAASDAPARPR